MTFGTTVAQEFKPFKVGIGLGYAAPSKTGAGAEGGFLLFVEPAYRATNNILIGLRLESAIIARGIKGVGADDVSGNASSNASYTLNTQFYFNENYVRPFVGAGLGFFSLAAVKFNTAVDNTIDNNEVATETRFGFYPRIGLDAGHFILTLDYNFIPKTDIPGVGEVNNNYLGIRVGFSIGGGVGQKRS
jgi:outer membrane protein X